MVITQRLTSSAARWGAIAAALLGPSLLAAAGGQSPPPPPRYVLFDFNTLLGAHRDGSVSIASMNKSGQIAGHLDWTDPEATQGNERAFVWRDGKVAWLPPLPGFSQSAALAQNQNGLVVGQVQSDRHATRACEWVNDRPRPLVTGHPGDSVAMAINARGDVVGGYSSPAAHGHEDRACLWRHGGGFLDLGPVVGLSTRRRGTGWIATSINERGEIWGRVTGDKEATQAGPTRVFWKAGHARPAEPQDGRPESEVRNHRGQVLRGSALVSGGKAAPLLWKGRPARGSDLNDRGDVVGGMDAVKLGLSPMAQRYGYDTHAFLYRAGRMYDLNDLIKQGTGEVLTDAVNIDGAGRILVWGRNRPLLLLPRHEQDKRVGTGKRVGTSPTPTFRRTFRT